MAPTSTDGDRPVRRHPLVRFGGPVLAALVAVPLAGLAITWGGSSGGDSASLATAVHPEDAHLAPERASRSELKLEEPAAPESTTTTVVRVEVAQVTEERPLAVPKVLLDDPALPRGETRVEADGSPGVERVVFEVTRHNGRIVAKRLMSSEIVTPASPRVVYVGRGGGRGAPTDNEDIPLKLRLAQGDEVAGPTTSASGPAAGRSAPKPRIAASERPGSDSPSPSGQQEGGASWYHYKPGTCAHRTLPKGTVVKVTNLQNGQTANCTVADRGPFIGGRIIDLDRSVFMAIADSPGQGVLRVRIEW
jgi:G5 domain/Lytic transglycolase